MGHSTRKTLLIAIFAALLIIGGLVFSVMVAADPEDATVQAGDNPEQALRAFIDEADKASGIQSGAAFNYALVGNGNATNFGILRCLNEVRCDNVVQKQVAKFQQPNQPSPDTAEVDTDTGAVVSLHRAIPEFVGGELPQAEIENAVRDFLKRVYPGFETMEPTLTFAPGMKGVRLNNGNYFYRWNDDKYTLPDGLSTDVAPFVQVSITASGFIFGYDNTIDLYHDALTEL